MKCANCLIREAKVIYEGSSLCGICFIDSLERKRDSASGRNKKIYGEMVKGAKERVRMWR